MSYDAVRHPRAEATLAGVRLEGLLSIEVETNGYFQANTARVTVALGALQAEWPKLVAKGGITLKIGLSSTLPTVFVGTVAIIEMDPISGTLMMACRDLGADMHENPARFKLMNYRADRVVERIAKRYNLKVETWGTTSTVGALLGEDGTTTVMSMTEWDYLSKLSIAEGRRLFIDGDTLYWLDDEDLRRSRYTLKWDSGSKVFRTPSSPVLDLRFTHNVDLGGSIEVSVKSWNVETEKLVVAATGRNRDRRKKKLRIDLSSPNLSLAQAEARARKTLRDVVRHEVRLEFSAPADSELNLATIIKVEGVGNGYDQEFYPDMISRQWSLGDGYKMRVRAVNRSPATPAPDAGNSSATDSDADPDAAVTRQIMEQNAEDLATRTQAEFDAIEADNAGAPLGASEHIPESVPSVPNPLTDVEMEAALLKEFAGNAPDNPYPPGTAAANEWDAMNREAE